MTLPLTHETRRDVHTIPSRQMVLTPAMNDSNISNEHKYPFPWIQILSVTFLIFGPKRAPARSEYWPVTSVPLQSRNKDSKREGTK